MRTDQALNIYEIRALSPEALTVFDRPGVLEGLGPALAGLHWEADFAFVFFCDEPGPEIAAFLAAHPELDLRHIHQLTYAQWQDGADATPFTVAGLCVIPAGGQDQNSTHGNGLRLVIAPGLAFGFGGHPTTHSCLEFLARACEGRGLGGPPRAALDLGAGTGVLSLAAALWGVPQVTGVDYSHLAVDAARHNITLNQLAEKVKIHRGPAQDFAAQPADLLLANLH
ncbi:MAG: 50S ribosomal protein L11 methyltransferase, partial [Candidatus Adiutrix sp.]|nr:50S ribosomal protein L11 methyltransferase [Candidatus Adiutrix sp.]